MMNMTRLIGIFTVLVTLLIGNLQADEANFELTVSGIKEDTGDIVIDIYNNATTWLGKEKTDIYKRVTIPVKKYLKDGSVSTSISLPSGEYAISTFHDTDGDGIMKTNFIGMPKDASGMSNNYKPAGRPKYERAKFEINTGSKKVMNIEIAKLFG